MNISTNKSKSIKECLIIPTGWLRYNEPSDNTMKPGPGAYAAEKVIIKKLFPLFKSILVLKKILLKNKINYEKFKKELEDQTFLQHILVSIRFLFVHYIKISIQVLSICDQTRRIHCTHS